MTQEEATVQSEPMLPTHDILNKGMERLLERDEEGKQPTHEKVCKQNVCCSDNLGYREYLNRNLVPVLVRLLAQNPDGHAQAAVIQNFLTTVFTIGASVALLGVQDDLADALEVKEILRG